MRVLPEVFPLVSKVMKVIAENKGRAADAGVSLPFLGSMVWLANGGNHVDIGTLYGASALTAAAVLQHRNLEGTVYCVDPYDAETRAKQVRPTEGMVGNLSGTPEELFKNAKDLGLEDRIKLVRKPSHPWPEELNDVFFATAYIDGNHLREAPWNDFQNLRGRVSHYIGADNYEEEYPDVVDAMWKAMNTDDWFLWYKNVTFVALRHILIPRSMADDGIGMLNQA